MARMDEVFEVLDSSCNEFSQMGMDQQGEFCTQVKDKVDLIAVEDFGSAEILDAAYHLLGAI